MTNVIGVGRFPSKKEVENRKKRFSQLIKDETIDQKITEIRKYRDGEIAVEIQDFGEEIIKIIDNIIDTGIDRYKGVTGEENPFTEETIKIWEEMYQRARGIEDMADYINDDEDGSFEIEGSYILESINNILSPYSSVVFEYLMNKKEKNNH